MKASDCAWRELGLMIHIVFLSRSSVKVKVFSPETLSAQSAPFEEQTEASSKGG